MSADQAAVTAAAADRELAGIEVIRVPEVWPPLDPAETASAFPRTGTSGDRPVRSPDPQEPWPQQFAVLLAEALTGARPVQQVLPWLSRRGSVQLHRLLPALRAEHRPRVLRVLTTAPSRDVIEMTLVVLIGDRARALAVRLERSAGPARPGKLAARWLCTDIEAG